MNVKRFILSVISALTIITTAFAQHESMPTHFDDVKSSKWGISVAYNDAKVQMAFPNNAQLALDSDGNMTSPGEKRNKSFSASFIAKYYLNRQWLIRCEYGRTNINLTNHDISSSVGGYGSPNYMIWHDTIIQNINRFVPSIQFNFFSSKNIESYGGVNVQYIKYGNITRNERVEQRYIPTDSLAYTSTKKINIPNGYATGIGVFAGFNVFVQKHISLGAEFSSGLLYYNVGGISSQIIINQYPSPTPTDITTYTNIASYKGVQFSKIFASFNITFLL